jgi:hypothetical protein
MKITLLKDHCHAGIEYLAGAVIDVEADTADYLQRFGIGTADEAEKSGKKK